MLSKHQNQFLNRSLGPLATPLRTMKPQLLTSLFFHEAEKAVAPLRALARRIAEQAKNAWASSRFRVVLLPFSSLQFARRTRCRGRFRGSEVDLRHVRHHARRAQRVPRRRASRWDGRGLAGAALALPLQRRGACGRAGVGTVVDGKSERASKWKIRAFIWKRRACIVGEELGGMSLECPNESRNT